MHSRDARSLSTNDGEQEIKTPAALDSFVGLVHHEDPVTRLIHMGDCVEWLEAFPDDSVDVTIMDPPYSKHVHEKSLRAPMGKASTRAAHATMRDQTARRKLRRAPIARDLGFDAMTPELQRNVAIEVARVTKRWVVVFCDPERISTWRFDLAGAGLECVRVGVWIKPNGSPQFTGDRPGTGYECLVIAHRPGAKHWNGGGHHAIWTHPIDTGNYGRERINKTEKPLSLMLELVRLFSDPNELVIDPFAGGGTTGVAARRLGRRFLGAEVDEAMAHTANERLLAEADQQTLAARRAGQLPMFGEARKVGS